MLVVCMLNETEIVDEDEVVNTASREGSGDSSLFSSALSFLKGNKVSLDYAHRDPRNHIHTAL